MQSKNSRGFVLHFFRAYPGRTSLMVALLVGSGLAEAVGVAALFPVLEIAASGPGVEPSGLARAVGGFVRSIGLTPTLAVLLTMIFLGILLKGVFRWLAMREVGFVVARVGMDLRLRLIHALMRAEWSYFTSTPTGHFANAISREAFQSASAYREACQALAGGVAVVVYSTVVVIASWPVALAALGVGVGVLFALRAFVSASRQAGAEQTAVMKSLVSRLTEALPNLKPLKAMARERYVLPMLEAEARGFNVAQKRQVLATETLFSFQEPLLVAAIALGLYSVITFTTLPFSTVMVLTFLFYRLVNHINQIQQRFTTMVSGEASFWSMIELIEETERAEELSQGKTKASGLKRSLVLKGISFSHGDNDVFRNVNLEITAGTFVALVGASGAGKTTLVDLIIGLYQPKEGRIQVDGVDLADLDLDGWRSTIGYVPQDLLLFHDSVLRNVRLGNEDISRERVEQALRDAGAWGFVQALPGGMDWVVGERGSMLSGGQRQRIAIARALAEGPSLLILDEATTALDPETEAAICETLANLKGRVTILAISHQAALREVADAIYEVGARTIRPFPLNRVQV